MKLEIISDSRDSAILVCDEDHNDIAEFYHSDHATVAQSYETALSLARKLVEGSSGVAKNSERLISTNFDEVRCLHADGCGWPECDCPRKADCHSPEAVTYAFNKARELLTEAGFVETAAILHESRPRVLGVAQAGKLPAIQAQALTAAASLISQKITKLSWSRDECRLKGQAIYVSNLTEQIEVWGDHLAALREIADGPVVSSTSRATGPLCPYCFGLGKIEAPEVSATHPGGRK